MAIYRYEAVNNAGKVIRGAMKARDEQEVTRNLTSKGYSPRAIYDGSRPVTPAPQSSQVSPAVRAAAAGPGVPVSVKSLVPASALAMFFRQLVTLVQSGIPLNQSFSDMESATSNGRLRRALPQMQQALQSGQKLSAAMAMFPNLFPVHATASVWAGEMAGRLDIVLDEVASDFEQEASDTRYGRIGWFVTKASIVLIILILPICDLSVLLAPTVDPTVGATLHERLLAIGKVALSLMMGQVPIALVVIASWVVWGYVKRIPSVKRALDRALLRVPVWGSLHRSRSVARFLHVLEGLYAAGIGPQAAWEAASLTPRNSAIAQQLRLARDTVASDAGVTEMFAASGAFCVEDTGLASAGEKSGKLPDVLANMSERYADAAAVRRTVGRTWSFSLLITSQLIFSGTVAILIWYSYYGKFVWSFAE